MLNSRAARSWLFAAVLATSFTALAVPVEAGTGAVRVRIVKMGFIIGAGGGEGVLTYRGRAYPFTVSGVGVGVVVGAAAAELVGRAYNLRQPWDIAGTIPLSGPGRPWSAACARLDCRTRTASFSSCREVRWVSSCRWA
jgi:hypothetical protein